MSYITLYRKYRPKCLNEIVGQEIVVQTLKNSLVSGRISHAYLFYGPRGIGKTSIAKILAKTVNCEKMPIEDACLECETCKRFSEDRVLEFEELDAASNNGVDEIRKLLDGVKYLPSSCKYKVYIIDEVHMLSTAAFNALLKTLEEPPSHVIFILATTEYHKIPATIISRCQCFEFKNVEPHQMKKRLKQICKEEEIKISDKSLDLIIENAQGGVRDAISYLDQVASFSNNNITEKDVYQVSGAIPEEQIITILENINSNKIKEILDKVNTLVNSGKQIMRIVFETISCLKKVLLSYVGDATEKLNITQLATKLTYNQVVYYLDCLYELLEHLPSSTLKQTQFELCLIKMCKDDKKVEFGYAKELETLKDDVKKLKDNKPTYSTSTTKDNGFSKEEKKETTPIINKPVSVINTPVPSNKKPLFVSDDLTPILNGTTKETIRSIQAIFEKALNTLGDSGGRALKALLTYPIFAASTNSFILYSNDYIMAANLNKENKKKEVLDLINSVGLSNYINYFIIKTSDRDIIKNNLSSYKTANGGYLLPSFDFGFYEEEEKADNDLNTIIYQAFGDKAEIL